MPSRCVFCPRYCRVDRERGERGFCKAGPRSMVALYDLHFWEEPPISGTRGSGAVFFSRCNLSCVFCQNYVISQEDRGKELTCRELAAVFLRLQEKGAHNVNLVSPTHYAGPVAEAIVIARKEGLSIPVVYNSNGYDSLEALELMEGKVDVYLPDLKYYSDSLAAKYSSAPSYFRHSSRAILEMSRQVGVPVLDEEGIIRRGLIVRHLVLPGGVSDSKNVLRWIKDNLPKGTYVSLMAQYYPTNKAHLYPEIDRKVTRKEYEEVVDELYRLGLEDGFLQELDSADPAYTPDFASSSTNP
ncbi:MAG: radical SAM protein [Candidatus Fermentithermobacillus carboniphilus]|uniref:Radical SAM protein n=1 Tax=Candidatus Fermentithermobacillus carboniphilus TaxID=3085328 RepID=A0AAT9LCJ8_9FIRM|nr:MAG: radical SAM protein [Candidatus Fermentithermobacillus carboniphilus]